MKRKDPWLRLTVEKGETATRLDSWLASKVPGLSRRQAQKMMAGGLITLDGGTAKKGDCPIPSSEIAIWAEPKPQTWPALPDPRAPLEIAYEDDYLVVVEKNAGISSVPLHPDEGSTLAGAVAARFSECALIGRSPGDSGLLQRLDRETSGLVLVARSQPIFDLLWELQRQQGIEKRYLALVSDTKEALPEVIETGLFDMGSGRVKVGPVKDGAPLQTRIRHLSSHGLWRLVQASIHRGFRHQIRAHLASVGSPVAGDAVYGKGSFPGLGRLFLHASELLFDHPVTKKQMHLVSPLPVELRRILRNG